MDTTVKLSRLSHTLERLFVLQAPDTLLSEASRWRQTLAVKEVDISANRPPETTKQTGYAEDEVMSLPEGSHLFRRHSCPGFGRRLAGESPRAER